MKYNETNTNFVIRLEKGEEIIESLKKFCNENKITSGCFSAIGAVSSAVLSFYDLPNKKYISDEFQEPMEICPIIGNIATKDNDTVIHAHATLGRENFTTIAGHLDKAIVAATCEINLQKTDFQLTRKLDPKIGLNLLDL